MWMFCIIVGKFDGILSKMCLPQHGREQPSFIAVKGKWICRYMLVEVDRPGWFSPKKLVLKLTDVLTTLAVVIFRVK